MVDLGSHRIELVGELLKPVRCLVDLIICVSHHVAFLLEQPVELLSQRHGMDDDRVVPIEIQDADLQQCSLGRWSDEHRQVVVHDN